MSKTVHPATQARIKAAALATNKSVLVIGLFPVSSDLLSACELAHKEGCAL